MELRHGFTHHRIRVQHILQYGLLLIGLVWGSTIRPGQSAASGNGFFDNASSPTVLVAGTTSGTILRSVHGINWHVQQNLGSDITALVVSKGSHIMYAAAGQVIWRSTDFGARWTALYPHGYHSINALALNPSDPNVIYVGTDNGLLQSTDGGATWLYVGSDVFPNMAIYSLAIDPRNPASVWAGSTGLYHSTDGGTTWSLVSDDTLTTYATIHAIAISPADHNVVYVATDHGLYQSTDGGATWVALGSDLLANLDVVGVTINPLIPSNVYAATLSGIYVSDDGGSTWWLGNSDLSLELSTQLIVDPSQPAVAYAATAQGLYRTTDGGHSWTNWSGGDMAPDASLASVAVLSLSGDHSGLLATSPASPLCCGGPTRYFPQTHHNLSGAFLAFYQRFGGLDTFGYPRSEPFQHGGRLQQYTDRFLLEYVGGRVTVASLGRTLTAGRAFLSIAPFRGTSSRTYFGSTGHSLTGRFLTYWRDHNGAILLGAPISEPLREQNGDSSGRQYMVQWFANGRLEYHPELAGTRYQVEVGLTGKQELQQLGWL